MRVAIVGNMNNNGFALMRYFRDLGEDAHLLTFSDDGTGAVSHFAPEADTWFMENWAPFVHRLPVANAITSALEWPLAAVTSLPSLTRTLFLRRGSWKRPTSSRLLRQVFSEYEYLIGSGIAPAIAERAGRRLDIFYPYCTGVEFVGCAEFAKAKNEARGLVAAAFRRAVWCQSKGIERARTVLNFETGETERVLRDLGATVARLAIPMVYNREQYSAVPSELEAVFARLRESEFSVLSHARHLWDRSSCETEAEWLATSKNNDWFVRGFAELVRGRAHRRPLLILATYGADIEATRRLVADLGLERYVLWLPRLGRRVIMRLMKEVSLVAGEFIDQPEMIWGGTGWEALACGKPLLQGHRFAPGRFLELHGYPPPPLLPVESSNDVREMLLYAADNTEDVRGIGDRAATWFDEYNGMACARAWLGVMKKRFGQV